MYALLIRMKKSLTTEYFWYCMVAPHCKSSKYLSILVELTILSPTISIGHLTEGGDPI